jgi:hypothetical protein
LTVAVASPQPSTIAVILLGSLEYRNQDYYDIGAEALLQKFPADKYKLLIGDYPQQMFNQFSDKQGLLPGEIPAEEKLNEFAWTHSFDKVLFIQLSAPSVKSNEVTLQFENAEVTISAHAWFFDSREKKKLSAATCTQTVKTLSRGAAKKMAYRKCLDTLLPQL